MRVAATEEPAPVLNDVVLVLEAAPIIAKCEGAAIKSSRPSAPALSLPQTPQLTAFIFNFSFQNSHI